MGKKITETERLLNEQANNEIKELIYSEMRSHNVTANTVAKRLTEMGRPIAAQGLRNAISAGTHKTTWYWDLMKAIKLSEDKDNHNA